MAVTSTSNLSNILMRVYTRDNWFVPFERNETPFLDQMEDFQNDEPLGQSRYFRLWFADAQASGSVAEGADLPAVGQPAVQQGSVTAIQYAAAIGLSELMLEAGRQGGVLDTDIVAAHVRMATRNLFSDINRATIGHGTSRLAVVEATTSAVATFVARLPEHLVQLRIGMQIAFYNTDTGGTLQGSVNSITALTFATRTVTMANSASLTAGWGVYKAISSTITTYGIATNGLTSIVDNGTLATTLYGLTKSTNAKLNATVIGASGGLQAYSEKLVRQGLHRLFHEVGIKDDHELQIWVNSGIIGEHYNFTTPDRVYMQGSSGAEPVNAYGIGYKQAPVFTYKGRAIPFMVDGDIPARSLYIWAKDLGRRHILRKASWIGDDTGVGGSASPILMQQPGASSQNYATAKIAGMMWMGNLTNLFPAANAALLNIADEELAGDAAVIP